MANKSDFKFRGLKALVSNMNREIEEIKDRSYKGMIEGVIIIWRKADPTTPLDTGNLRSSFFVVSQFADESSQVSKTGNASLGSFKGDDASEMRSNHSNVVKRAEQVARNLSQRQRIFILYGYSANYAPYVHENTELNIKRPKGKTRWFYSAIQSSKNEVLEAIRKEARIR